MTNQEERNRHEEPHTLEDVRFVGNGGWAICHKANADASHHEFRLVRGDDEGELLVCYEGDPGDSYGVPPADVLEMLAHAGWHIATTTPPGACDSEYDLE